MDPATIDKDDTAEEWYMQGIGEDKDDAANVFLADRLLRQFLTFPKRHKEAQTWRDVDISPDIKGFWRSKFERKHEECKCVFDIPLNEVVSQFKGIEPVVFDFKEGVKTFHIPEPRWTPAQYAILHPYFKAKIDAGTWFQNPTATTANRPHLAIKHLHRESKGVKIFDVRKCIDMTGTNPRYKRAVPNYPNTVAEIERAAGHIRYIMTDMHGQFEQIVVAKGPSQDSMTCWAPGFGKVTPKRLVFGQMNAATIAQGIVRRFYEEDLSDATRARLSSFQDDACLYAGDAGGGESADQVIGELYKVWCDYLDMCVKRNITLSPGKTHIGYETAEFYGHEVDKNGHRQLEKNLDPIAKCAEPENAKELRSVLGMFVQGMHRIKDYAVKARELHGLLRKDVEWDWTPKCADAFNTLKKELLARPFLHAPNFREKLYLSTDASDDGKGAVLWQRGKDGGMRVISWYSKAWTPAMRARPVYYREAEALYWGIGKVKFYAQAADHTLTVLTDQQPLRWARHSEKGLVTKWRVEVAGDVDYTVEYTPGETNFLADAASRYPMLGPRRITRMGLEHSFERLLSFLPDSARDAPRAWLHAGKDTATLSRKLQAWRTPKNAIVQTKPREGYKFTAGLHIFVSVPEAAPILARRLLDAQAPFAILIPSDLVQYVADGDTEEDKVARKRLEATAKLTHLSAGLTWLVGGLPTTEHLVTCAAIVAANEADAEGETPTETAPPELTGWLREKVGSLEDWASNSETSLKLESAKIDDSHVARRSSGLVLYAPDGASAKIYVPLGSGDDPTAWRRELCMLVHHELQHLGHTKVHAQIARSFWWPSMRTFVQKAIEPCVECNLAKGRRQRAHGKYRAVAGGGRQRSPGDSTSTGRSTAKCSRSWTSTPATSCPCSSRRGRQTALPEPSSTTSATSSACRRASTLTTPKSSSATSSPTSPTGSASSKCGRGDTTPRETRAWNACTSSSGGSSRSCPTTNTSTSDYIFPGSRGRGTRTRAHPLASRRTS